MSALLGDIGQIASLLEQGLPVAIPTDTVCGVAVAVNAVSDPGVLFRVKERPLEKAIPWLVGSLEDLATYSQNLPDWARRLAEAHWPGALTLVCPAAAGVPAAFLPADRTLALRMPDHPLVLQLIRRLGTPLACTSANISGAEPVSRIADLDPRLVERLAGLLDDRDWPAPPAAARPSTIISCLADQPTILRVGALDLSAELAAVIE
ncbi:MAG: L-threonylcarbamoyladenylate synthase [Actinomycetia bacterium]|nr:L-threonylcarbamoyladenylate synthase [Actinomycetes bacterium]